MEFITDDIQVIENFKALCAEFPELPAAQLWQAAGGVCRPTMLAPDSLKAAVLSLPKSVKVENALPAVSG